MCTSSGWGPPTPASEPQLPGGEGPQLLSPSLFLLPAFAEHLLCASHDASPSDTKNINLSATCPGPGTDARELVLFGMTGDSSHVSLCLRGLSYGSQGSTARSNFWHHPVVSFEMPRAELGLPDTPPSQTSFQGQKGSGGAFKNSLHEEQPAPRSWAQY